MTKLSHIFVGSILALPILTSFSPGHATVPSTTGGPTPRFGARPLQASSPAQNQTQQANQVQPSSSSPQEQNSGQGTPVPQPGTIVGTVTDMNDDPVARATVSLQGTELSKAQTVATNDNGFFEIHDVEPGIPYRVAISAMGFAPWESPVVILKPGQHETLDVSQLRLEEVKTSVTVTPESSEEIAIQQVKIEEKQRGLGIIPNFFEVYTPNPAPLTAKLKFSLGLRVARDPFTAAGVALLAGAGQAAATPDYVQGAKGFAQRFGANYANQFTDVMIGGAILPSLLHQDPRYYYQGTGTKKSRILHAVSNLIITKGDNGHWQPNYSSLGGDLASATISNLYYPESNRGVRLVFQNFAIDSAVHLSVRLLQEFIFRPAKGSTVRNAGDPSVQAN